MMNEEMAASDSVSGVSRSGRVRKKSAKLIEMEDQSEFENGLTDMQHPQQSQLQQTQRKSNKKPLHGSSQFHTQSEPIKVSSKRKMTPSNDGRIQASSSSSSTFQSKMEQRVIAIKQVDPPATFEALSGSAYLIGDDVHFITGEPIDSEGEDVVDNNNRVGGSSGVGYHSPLKIEVGGSGDVPSLHDESGIKMKFILSPKPSSKSEGKSGHSKKKSSGKSGLKRSSSGGGGSKSKKKKKKDHIDGSDNVMPVLEALAAGGIPNSAFGLDSDSDDHGDSRLIIAEPPVLQPMVSIGKSKKKSSSGSGGDGHKSTKKKNKKKSGSSKVSNKLETESGSVNTEGIGQQKSLYLKEKNTSKKKSSKREAKAKDKKGNKTRPASAYMVWCRENRTRIVSENPGMDFAAISRRLGEHWQSLSDFEKMGWRRKAKAQSSMKSSNVIKTGKKPVESSSEKVPTTGGKVVPKHILAAAKAAEESPVLSKEVHRPVGTTPLDVAAHLKLLGESLSIIGQRLTEHMGQIAVSGSLSVLLDSTLCALAPLICLTSEVDQLDGCPKETQERILDHIAYIMPGL